MLLSKSPLSRVQIVSASNAPVLDRGQYPLFAVFKANVDVATENLHVPTTEAETVMVFVAAIAAPDTITAVIIAIAVRISLFMFASSSFVVSRVGLYLLRLLIVSKDNAKLITY